MRLPFDRAAVPVARRTIVTDLVARGLRIVRSLAHEWGVADGPPSPQAGARTVWASLGGPSRRRAW